MNGTGRWMDEWMVVVEAVVEGEDLKRYNSK
jgi:hypothetical protein